MTVTLLQGDTREVLKTLPAASVQCVVTSPPYYGLRDYGVDGQIGLEQTPEAYIAALVDVFRGLWRVLRDDGTVWLNLGDSYWGGKGQSSQAWSTEHLDRATLEKSQHQIAGLGQTRPTDGKHETIKPKDLIGIPWRVALALQADGWYLRSDIIWHKPNPMPESVTDRPTKAHEYIFLLTKAARYYYDNEAVKEESTAVSGGGFSSKYAEAQPNHGAMKLDRGDYSSGRNRRSVWTVATQPYAEAHFATYPPKLIEPCILAGTSERGACPKCGKAWERDIHREAHYEKRQGRGQPEYKLAQVDSSGWKPAAVTDNGWNPACSCNAGEPVPCVVLDPFNGAGTTGLVAIQHNRDYIGIELNPEYIELTNKRLVEVQPKLFFGGITC